MGRRDELVGGYVMVARDGFIGREPEQEKISLLLLDAARLITLTGQGGIGKTRLATETLRRFRKARDTPVYWARLARLPKEAGVTAIEEEVARCVVDADFSGRTASEVIVSALTRMDGVGHSLQTVLVMDNCEHLLTAAGEVIARLLEAVPGLTILATSREAVGWADEHLIQVSRLTRSQALLLFRQRAELTGRLVIDEEQSDIASRICQRVHDNPLYIRLAAARLLRQPLAGILSELNGEPTDRRMRWSHGPRVGADPRHRGVRDVIAWSYDLCTDKERLLLERMSVFAAGYDTNPEDDAVATREVGADLHAIEAICADAQPPEPDRDDTVAGGAPATRLAADEVEDLLERLADQSLVTVHITPTTARYSLLESIRVFAQHELARRRTGTEDERALRIRRHRRYYRDRVLQARLEWLGPADQDPQAWTRAAWDNIVTAIESSLTAGEPTVGLKIVVGLMGLTDLRGPTQGVRQWIERALRATRAQVPQSLELHLVQIAAMAALAWLALLQGRVEDAEHTLHDCVVASFGDPEIGPDWRHAPEVDAGLIAPVEFVWGAVLFLAHRDPRSVTVFGRAREKFGSYGDRGGEAWSELYEAMAASFLGSADAAVKLSRQHFDRAVDAPAGWAKAWAELAWAIALTKHGDPAEALIVGRSALAHQVEARDPWGAVLAVYVRMGGLAQVGVDLVAAGNADRAVLETLATEIAHLAGGASRELAEMGVDISGLGPIADESSRVIEVARVLLGEDAYAAAEWEGRKLRPELGEVQQLALGTLSEERTPQGRTVAEKKAPSLWSQLSGAEHQVAILAAAGWTNTAIAARRGSSSKTVDAQMASILQKLMITSRADIIGLVPKDRGGEVRTEAAKRPRRINERQRKVRPSPK
ncbi:helix-turn-helix transcriptional regulator [Nocardia bovistercoris]|uniref:HTH luxR-type domain-containing protein n=1 Tax=Nocardia bovistercoris TaxID=2785916 RepID=A0A931N3U1_9NOCA|nr:LuxR C-terminal-related transcriptional regulator [Nocardia bovistercoris]MBH0778087.1 hypothetical protein [Nocardia bovistercoris]